MIRAEASRLALLWLLLCCFFAFSSGVVCAAELPNGYSALIPVDATELKGRTPLILVHGINPDPDETYGWEGFLERTVGNEQFKTRYKPYLYVFDTTRRVRDNAQTLRETIRKDTALGNGEVPPYCFLALSLGGLVVREALSKDPILREQTGRVIAIGSPFHGTPLATPSWMRQGVREQGLLSRMRLFSGLAYRVTRRKFPHFERDFGWDNFDGALPENVLKNGQTEPSDWSGKANEAFPEYIVYGGFFGVPETEKNWLSEWLQVQPAISNPEMEIRKGRVGKHLMFRLVSSCLALLPMNDGAKSEDKQTIASIMTFNDGVSPISSQLWLGRLVSANPDSSQALSQESQWEALRTLKNTGRARLFEGLDHRDWLMGKTRYRKSDGKLLDWLHAHEPPRDIFDWLLSDLLATGS